VVLFDGNDVGDKERGRESMEEGVKKEGIRTDGRKE
jgi:hypothetical protein